MLRWVPVAVCLLSFTLAGCSDPAPTGKLANLNFATPVGGQAVVDYQPFEGANPGGGAPDPLNGTLQCAQDQVPPGPVPSPLPPCKGPWTAVQVNLANAAEPGAGTYNVYLTGPAATPRQIGTLTMTGTNATMAPFNVTQDLSGVYDKVEVRLDDFLLAVAPATEGPQMLALAAGVNTVTAEGTYVGSKLDVTIAGLPASNATYMGALYLRNPDGSVAAAPAEMFPVTNGPRSYESKAHAIVDFAEFHVHVGDSKVNLYKASIVPDA